MARWLFVLLVVFLALVSVASPAPAQVHVLPHHAYFPLAAKNYPEPTPTPTPYSVRDFFVYPEKPRIGQSMFILAFGPSPWCGGLLDYSCTVSDKHILITADLGYEEGRNCYPEEPIYDWSIVEHIHLGQYQFYSLGKCYPLHIQLEPGEWTAEIVVTVTTFCCVKTEILSINFDVLPSLTPTPFVDP